MIVVPENMKYQKPTKLLFATDLMMFQEDFQLELIKEICDLNNSSIHSLHVSDKLNIVDSEEKIFEGIEDCFKGTPLKRVVLYKDNIDNTIMKYSKDNEIDIILMMTKKKGLIKKWFVKSHTKQLIGATNIPLLVFPQNNVMTQY